ncbi:MAG: O-antigen ligase family protein [Solirubrobacteraceae bacterium]
MAGLSVCTAVALLATAVNLKGNPPIAGATAQATIDLPQASIIQNNVSSDQLQALNARALLLGELISTPPVLADIAHRAGIPVAGLKSKTSYIHNIPEQMLGPDLEIRGMQIIKLRAPFQLDIEPDPNLPRFEIYARAPSIPAAAKLADSVVPGLVDYLRADAIGHGVDPANQVRVSELGEAQAALLESHARYEIALLTFTIAWALCGALLLCVPRIGAGWKLAAARRGFDPVAPCDPQSRSPRRPDCVGGPAVAGRADRQPGRAARAAAAQARDDWPHTNRILPWLIAGFLVVLWLVPFNSIALGGASIPIDLKFDRIVLPIIVLTWILALAAGGKAGPRIRLSWVHVGILGFAAMACFTFVVNAHYLDQTLQIDRGVKQLMLLGAYVIFFVMSASVLRPSEVPAFLRYALILAVIAGLGTLVEYRFHYNVFYDLAHRLLPGFQVGAGQSSGVDDLGRRLVEGPAEVPLEAVGMFTLALPIALIGVIDAKRWRPRIIYGLATAILMAAAVSTERKSGLLGPLGVVVALVWFRRVQMVRLIPLAVVMIAVVKVLAPGAIGGTTGQLAPNALGVSTVDERIVRWDAIRPDVWLHLAVGQGFGVYSIRVLDDEYLDRLIEGGVLGLSAYLVMLLIPVFLSTGSSRRREPGTATIAVIVAPAAVGTLVLSGTYDSFGFPHVPYLFFFLCAMLAVTLKSPDGIEEPQVTSGAPSSASRLRRARAPELPPRSAELPGRPADAPGAEPEPVLEPAWR